MDTINLNIDDITDKESLERWLKVFPKDQQYQCSNYIASRVAARVFPVYGYWIFDDQKYEYINKVSAVFIFRRLIVSALSVNVPYFDMKLKKIAKTAAVNASSASSEVVAYNAAKSSYHAASYTATEVLYHAVSSIEFAVLVNNVLSTVIWDAIREDLFNWMEAGSEFPSPKPLWHDQKNPLDKEWQTTRSLMQAEQKRGVDWSFWIKWYEGQLNGTPLDHDLSYQIATSDGIDWGQDDSAINEQINQIVQKWPQTYHEIDTANTSVDNFDDNTDLKGSNLSNTIANTQSNQIINAIKTQGQAIPYTLSTITFLVENELNRLQGRNYQSDEDRENCERFIKTLTNIAKVTEQLQQQVEDPKSITEQDIGPIKETLQHLGNTVRKVLSKNSADYCDGTIRVALIGLTTASFGMFGMPIAGTLVGAGLFIKKKGALKDIASAFNSG